MPDKMDVTTAGGKGTLGDEGGKVRNSIVYINVILSS